jgi:hypothetical protein
MKPKLTAYDLPQLACSSFIELKRLADFTWNLAMVGPMGIKLKQLLPPAYFIDCIATDHLSWLDLQRLPVGGNKVSNEGHGRFLDFVVV